MTLSLMLRTMSKWESAWHGNGRPSVDDAVRSARIGGTGIGVFRIVPDGEPLGALPDRRDRFRAFGPVQFQLVA